MFRYFFLFIVSVKDDGSILCSTIWPLAIQCCWIKGINTQDFALQEGMGGEPGFPAVVDRSREHLGSTDRVIIALRRQFIEALA